jgi:uncharacterized membrane protein (UPF0136 family)
LTEVKIALGCGNQIRHCSRMSNFALKVLWIYIVLLVIGGLIGFFKGKSQVSLIMSVVFAVLLIITAIPGFLTPQVARGMADGLLAALLVVFTIRLTKTKKFMPSGLMLILTIAALALCNLRF